ncbi:MAG: FliO/MopB family protein [Vicinamibacterales bacterium]
MIAFLVAVQDGIAFVGDPTPVSGRAVLVAFAVVALVGGLAWWLRHTLPVTRGRQGISVETAMSLGERRSLVVVAVENKRFLLGLTPQQVTLVADLGPAQKPGFQQALQASIDGGGGA